MKTYFNKSNYKIINTININQFHKNILKHFFNLFLSNDIESEKDYEKVSIYIPLKFNKEVFLNSYDITRIYNSFCINSFLISFIKWNAKKNFPCIFNLDHVNITSYCHPTLPYYDKKISENCLKFSLNFNFISSLEFQSFVYSIKEICEFIKKKDSYNFDFMNTIVPEMEINKSIFIEMDILQWTVENCLMPAISYIDRYNRLPNIDKIIGLDLILTECVELISIFLSSKIENDKPILIDFTKLDYFIGSINYFTRHINLTDGRDSINSLMENNEFNIYDFREFLKTLKEP